MKVKSFYGSALRNSLLQQIIENTKIQKPARTIYDDGDIYYLDEDLSTRTIRIYYSPGKKHCVISHSSTIANTKEIKQSLSDIGDDIKMFFFGNRSTTRYREGLKTQINAENKYTQLGYDITNVGYSLGAQTAKTMGENKFSQAGETIVYNKPILLYDIITDKGQKDNTYVVSTSNDITSTLRPFEKQHKNNYVFDSQTYNPIDAHFNDRLKLIDANKQFGDPNIGSALNIKKLKVKDLKEQIKKHRKGSAKQYPITNKTKRELVLMLEDLIKHYD